MPPTSPGVNGGRGNRGDLSYNPGVVLSPFFAIKNLKRNERLVNRVCLHVVGCLAILSFGPLRRTPAADGSRFAHHDGDARYLHHIDLYDSDNRKITADSETPYSPLNTCGRCHDYATIAHGWHFNALADSSLRGDDGRPSEPWIWTDARTGTQLPLSPREHVDRFDPEAIGISDFELIRHFGARLPGTMAVPHGAAERVGLAGDEVQSDVPEAADADAESDEPDVSSRWELSGALEIDCMVCHAVSGRYDMESRKAQIDDENFAWAPTAALRLGTVKGSVSRIKTGEDPDDEKVQAKLPKVAYDASRFSADGTVFFDLVRMPENNACYQCHSQRTVDDSGIAPRWVHDEDIHLRAGMQCVDCHRNGIDHDIVRGFSGQQHVSGVSIETFTCAGCHLGVQGDAGDHETDTEIVELPGRLASPIPLHEGLPPLHFDKLSCTACHSGPMPEDAATRLMTSLAHSLGSKDHRTGNEWPSIQGPVFARLPASETDEAGSPVADSRVYPQRATWPAFFAEADGESLTPLPPESVYEITRRALRVRNDFAEEVTQPKLSRSERAEVLGDQRARVDDAELTEEELQELSAKRNELGRAAFDEKVAAALEAIQQELGIGRAAYVSTGKIFVTRTSADLKGDAIEATESDDVVMESLALLDPERFDQSSRSHIDMLTWPLAHNVRGAGQSLGVGGCLDCHSEQGLMFTSTVTSMGPAPVPGRTVTMASLQSVDEDQRLRWNQMFAGRALFKYLIGASLLTVLLVMLLGIAAKAGAMALQRDQDSPKGA